MELTATNAFHALESVVVTPPPEREKKLTIEAIFAYAFSGVDIKTTLPSRQQRQILSDVVVLTWGLNDLDVFAHRAQRGNISLEFIEDFHNYSQHEAEFKTKAREAGFREDVLIQLDNWKLINRMLNFANVQIYDQGQVEWDKFNYLYKDDPSLSTEQNHQEMERIRALMSQTEAQINKAVSKNNPGSTAIMLRAISSVGYAQMLTSFALNRPLENTENDLSLLRTTAAEVMVAQMIDDVGSPIKDIRYKTMGMASSSFSHSSVDAKGALRVSSEDASTAVAIAKEVCSGCLAVIESDTLGKWAHLTLKAGVAFSAAAGMFNHTRTFGGSHYPFFHTTWEAISQIMKKTPQEAVYRQETIDDLDTTSNLFITYNH